MIKSSLRGLLSLVTNLAATAPEPAVVFDDFMDEIEKDPWCRDDAVRNRFINIVMDGLPGQKVTLNEAKSAVLGAVADILREEKQRGKRSEPLPSEREMAKTARLIAETAFYSAARTAAQPTPQTGNHAYPDFIAR